MTPIAWKPGFVGNHRIEDIARTGPRSSPFPTCSRCKKCHPLWLNCGILDKPGAYFAYTSAGEHRGNVRERGRLLNGVMVWEAESH